jgi:hypothetical protein
MNQIDQTTAHAVSALSKVTTGSLPASSKRHVAGVIHPDILVPMRQIAVHPSSGEPPVTIYDASGPYTDPAVQTDIAKGLAPVRSAWMAARGDCDAYTARSVQPADNGFATSCASAGVMGPAVASLGAVQAQMALSVLIGLEPSPLGRIVTLDMASWRFGGFGFGDAPEAPGFGFVAAAQIPATDTVIDLRPEGTVQPIQGAQMVAPGDLADWPIPAGRVVLCCSTGLRAWRGAQVLADGQ